MKDTENSDGSSSVTQNSSLGRMSRVIPLGVFYTYLLAIMVITFVWSIHLFLKGEIPMIIAIIGVVVPLGLYYTVFTEIGMRLKDELGNVGKLLYPKTTE